MDYKYIEYTDYGSAQFFDMISDPKEAVTWLMTICTRRESSKWRRG